MIYIDKQKTLNSLVYIRGRVEDIFDGDPKVKPVLAIIDAQIESFAGAGDYIEQRIRAYWDLSAGYNACSNCGHSGSTADKYCPNCGAIMEGQKE